MKLVLHVNLSFALIMTTLETYITQMTLSTPSSFEPTYFKDTLPEHSQQTNSITELKQLNQILKTRINELETLCHSLRFLRRLSNNFLYTLNELNDNNKLTSIEVHGVPALHMKEQYFLVAELSKQLMGYYNDEDIAGIREFFTYKNTQNRNLIVQFKTVKIKHKWFQAFVDKGRSMGHLYMRTFPGFNLTIYKGQRLPPITIIDHLSKHKASVLRVAQGLLCKFKYVKVLVNNTQVYVDHKIGTDKFVRYWIRDFEDARNLKHVLAQKGVPMMLDHCAHDEITPNWKYVFTKSNKKTSKVNPAFYTPRHHRVNNKDIIMY
ncbi:hypothetical protein WDU94_011697 [Cyamophila willieti]